jgi:hypothetical protein
MVGLNTSNTGSTEGCAMIHVRGRLGFTDPRYFSLIGYQPGHAYALFRGFPPSEEIEDSQGNQEFRMLDICFAGVDRISCWLGVGPIHLRHPSDEEQAALDKRIRPSRYSNVYLLKPDSIEEHVIAHRVYWAEYDLTLTAPSPLVGDEDYQQERSPVGGPVQFVDRPLPTGLIVDPRNPKEEPNDGRPDAKIV